MIRALSLALVALLAVVSAEPISFEDWKTLVGRPQATGVSSQPIVSVDEEFLATLEEDEQEAVDEEKDTETVVTPDSKALVALEEQCEAIHKAMTREEWYDHLENLKDGEDETREDGNPLDPELAGLMVDASKLPEFLHLADDLIAIKEPHVGLLNDFCKDSLDLFGTGVFEFDTTKATTDGKPSRKCHRRRRKPKQIFNDVWFCWESDFTGWGYVSTCKLTQADTFIAIYATCDCPPQHIIKCRDDSCWAFQSWVPFYSHRGAKFLIRIGSWSKDVFGRGYFKVARWQKNKKARHHGGGR